MMDSIFTNPFNVMYFEDEEKAKADWDEYYPIQESGICVKLKFKENPLLTVDQKDLLRNVKPLEISKNIVEDIGSNYIIAKKIISNLPWQDKLNCKLVCSTWYSAVQTLQREQLTPEDFVMDLHCSIKNGGKGWFKQSGIFTTEPLVIFTFANAAGFSAASKCFVINPRPCVKSCDKDHSLLDLINQQYNSPKNCMLTVRVNHVIYKPLRDSYTYAHTLGRYNHSWMSLFLSGLYIPKIPNVGFKVLNILSQSENGLKQDFYDVVDKVSKDHIIKGVLVYVTEKYLLNSVEDIVFLNYFKDVQPNIPYALGGCIIEDTMSSDSDINLLIDKLNKAADYVSENLVSIGLFTVPKNTSNNECNFEMYSYVIDSSSWCKQKVQESVTEFSKSVPRYEHSIVIKLSCVGREQKHVLELDCFREAFPDTKIVGCYGNGELGVYHPAKTVPEPPPLHQKRRRRDPGPQFGIMYSYSTVFVYIGWGKITSPKGPI